VLLLFAGLVAEQGALAPLNASNASLGGAPCNISAVSDDGAWAVLDTPTAAALCGSDVSAARDCGYATLTLTTSPYGGALGASLACPPFCAPGRWAGASSLWPSGDGFGLGPSRPLSLGALPLLLPRADHAASSEGFYYRRSVHEDGPLDGPCGGACSNASDPAALACAYGSGGACAACPVGALCPGAPACGPAWGSGPPLRLPRPSPRARRPTPRSNAAAGTRRVGRCSAGPRTWQARPSAAPAHRDTTCQGTAPAQPAPASPGCGPATAP